MQRTQGSPRYAAVSHLSAYLGDPCVLCVHSWFSMALRVHNTLTGRVEEFTPLQPGKVGMYVCGVTVYDRSHIGHARALVVFDVIYRYLRSLGYEVTFVRNFT